MAKKFMQTVLTPAVRKAQEHYFGKSQRVEGAPERDVLFDDEITFIESRDSFYMATVTENGWPYVQHRGGPTGFLRVVGPNALAFADYKGNRQLISTGNLARSDRVALFLMDYPQRTRLKILGHACVKDARDHPELVTRIADAGEQRFVERLFFIDVVSYDWNCPKYITPRYTNSEIEGIIEPLRRRIAELEAELGKRG
jgi:predicted pyridoxine 5'-phosphate oxidase superfamily flavin-nucleotide-binding protein